MASQIVGGITIPGRTVRSGGIHRQSQEIIMELIMVKIAGSGNSENSGSTGSISWNESNYGTEDSFQISGSTNSGDNRNTGNHRSEATLTPKISASPTPVPTRKPVKTQNPTYPPKVSKSPRISPASQKQQKLALFYYRTDKTADAASDKEKIKNNRRENTGIYSRNKRFPHSANHKREQL